MVLGGMMVIVAPPSGVTVGASPALEPYQTVDLVVPHYIDSEDSEGDNKSDHTPDITPPPPLKTIAFDWSSLSFGDLQFSHYLPEERHDEEKDHRQFNNRNSAELLPDDIYNDNLNNVIINSEQKQNKDKLKDPKAIFRNCKRKIIRSGKNLKDRSRSVETFYKTSSKLRNGVFRNRSTEQKSRDECDAGSTPTNNTQPHANRSTLRPSSTHSAISSNRNIVNSRNYGRTGSVASLPAGAKLRSKLRDSVWVAGVRRRESIGLLTQPMMSALRGAGRRVKYRARSVSKSRGSLSGGSDDSHSAAHSSDYDEDAERPDSASLLDRFRGLRKDMQKKISKVKSPRGHSSGSSCVNEECGVPGSSDARSSLASPPTDAAAAPSDRVTLRPRIGSSSSGCLQSPTAPPPPAPYTGPFIGRAVALADFQPSPYDIDLLKFKKGDVIDIISKSPSGQWKGCVDGRVGEFKFILVEEESQRGGRGNRRTRGARPTSTQHCPHASLEALLKHLQLGHLLQVFMLNGYENLEQFREVEEADLDSLGIKDPDTRTRLLGAVSSILDYEHNSSLSIVGQVSEASVANNTSSSSRDSGCFTDQKVSSNLAPDVEDAVDGRQSSPSTDNSSGYQSRGNYNITVAEVSSTLQEVPDTTLDSSSSTEDAPISRNKKYASSSDTNSKSDIKDSNDADSSRAAHEPDSYRATPVTVRPGTPDPGEEDVESENKYFEVAELRKKSGPVESVSAQVSPRCSSDTGVSSVASDGGSLMEEPPGSEQC